MFRNSQDPEGKENDPKVVVCLLQIGQVPTIANMPIIGFTINKEWFCCSSLLLSSSDQYDENDQDIEH